MPDHEGLQSGDEEDDHLRPADGPGGWDDGLFARGGRRAGARRRDGRRGSRMRPFSAGPSSPATSRSSAVRQAGWESMTRRRRCAGARPRRPTWGPSLHLARARSLAWRRKSLPAAEIPVVRSRAGSNPPAPGSRLGRAWRRSHDDRVPLRASPQCRDLSGAGHALRPAPDWRSSRRSPEMAVRSAIGDHARFPRHDQPRVSGREGAMNAANSQRACLPRLKTTGGTHPLVHSGCAPKNVGSLHDLRPPVALKTPTISLIGLRARYRAARRHDVTKSRAGSWELRVDIEPPHPRHSTSTLSRTTMISPSAEIR